MINHLKQDATVWAATPDGFGGYTFGSPTAIKCRWEDKNELIPGSSTEMSNAVVYVDRDISVEDFIYLGTSASNDPTTLNAWRVRSFQKLPDLRNLNTLRKVWL